MSFPVHVKLVDLKAGCDYIIFPLLYFYKQLKDFVPSFLE